jgi:hypothetical protein
VEARQPREAYPQMTQMTQMGVDTALLSASHLRHLRITPPNASLTKLTFVQARRPISKTKGSLCADSPFSQF